MCYGLPSIKEAMLRSPGQYRFLVHTDSVDLLTPYFTGMNVEFLNVPDGSDNHHKMGNCHREAFDWADVGEYVIPMTADLVFSRECFAAASKRFADGKKLIVCAASRCLLRGEEPPIGASSKELLSWTVDNSHPSIRELYWGTGRSGVPWSIYFKTAHGIVLRGLHLHPFAVVKHEGLNYHGVNIDESLASEFSTDEIHVVTDKNELALAELSPPDRLFQIYHRPMNEKSVFKWALDHTNRRHHWLFGHRIVIQGTDKGTSDLAPCQYILDKLSYARVFCYGKEAVAA
jgi:hypothetical protein